MQRVVVTLGAVAVMLGMTVGPAAAATASLSVSWDGTSGSTPSFNPASLTINSGDSVSVAYSSSDATSEALVYPDASCTGSFLAAVLNGQSGTLSPSQTTTYGIGAVDTSSFVHSTCAPFVVTVNGGAPPPDVPEAPLAAGLLGAGVLVFGGGFFFVRRRRARVA